MTSKWFVTQIMVYPWGTTLLDLLREVMTRTRKMGPLRVPLVGEPSHLERCHPPAFHYVLAVDVSVFCVEIWHIGWKHGAEKRLRCSYCQMWSSIVWSILGSRFLWGVTDGKTFAVPGERNGGPLSLVGYRWRGRAARLLFLVVSACSAE